MAGREGADDARSTEDRMTTPPREARNLVLEEIQRMVIWHTAQANEHHFNANLGERNHSRALVDALVGIHNRMLANLTTRDHDLLEYPRWERSPIRGRFDSNAELVAEVFALRRSGVGWHDIARSTGATYNQVWRIYNYGRQP